jgi:hypothetical protein
VAFEDKMDTLRDEHRDEFNKLNKSDTKKAQTEPRTPAMDLENIEGTLSRLGRTQGRNLQPQYGTHECKV